MGQFEFEKPPILGPVEGFFPIHQEQGDKLYIPNALNFFEFRVLAEKVKKVQPPEGYDVLIALSRGGLAAGQILGYNLNPKNVLSAQTSGYDENDQLLDETVLHDLINPDNLPKEARILVVDDLVDSGGALSEAVLPWVREKLAPVVLDSAVVYNKDYPDREFQPSVCVRRVPNLWLEFSNQATNPKETQMVEEVVQRYGSYLDVFGNLGRLNTIYPSTQNLEEILEQTRLFWREIAEQDSGIHSILQKIIRPRV